MEYSFSVEKVQVHFGNKVPTTTEALISALRG